MNNPTTQQQQTSVRELPAYRLKQSGSAIHVPGGYIPRRWTVTVLLYMSIAVCYILRTNISLAVIPMSHQLGWSDTERGFVLSGFFAGYFFTQVAGGAAAAKWGGKTILAFGVLWPALATILTPAAAMSSLTVLLVLRGLTGAGEGVVYPAVTDVLSHWVPARERSTAVAAVMSAGAAGNVVALAWCGPLIRDYGWEAAFYIPALTGPLWYIAWQILATSSPKGHPYIHSGELADLVSAGSGAPAFQKPGSKSSGHPTPSPARHSRGSSSSSLAGFSPKPSPRLDHSPRSMSGITFFMSSQTTHSGQSSVNPSPFHTPRGAETSTVVDASSSLLHPENNTHQVHPTGAMTYSSRESSSDTLEVPRLKIGPGVQHHDPHSPAGPAPVGTLYVSAATSDLKSATGSNSARSTPRASPMAEGIGARVHVPTQLGHDGHDGSTDSKPTSSPSVPWGRVLCSGSIWAMMGIHFSNNWMFYTMMTWLPAYFRDELNFDLSSAGTASYIPYIFHSITAFVAGWICDCAIASGWRSLRVRQIAAAIGLLVPSAALIGLFYVETTEAAVILLTGAVASSAPLFAVYAPNVHELAPSVAGSVFGLSNTLATIPGIISPALTGAILDATDRDWSIVWAVAIAVNMASLILFVLAGGDKNIVDVDPGEGNQANSGSAPGDGSGNRSRLLKMSAATRYRKMAAEQASPRNASVPLINTPVIVTDSHAASSVYESHNTSSGGLVHLDDSTTPESLPDSPGGGGMTVSSWVQQSPGLTSVQQQQAQQQQQQQQQQQVTTTPGLELRFGDELR